MASNHYSPNLLVVMDCLWFNQTILFSEPISLHVQTPIATPPPPLDISSTTVSNLEEEILSDTSSISSTSPKDTHDYATDTTQDEEEEDSNNNDNTMQIQQRSQSLITTKTRSHSSSPSLHNMNTYQRSQSLITTKSLTHASSPSLHKLPKRLRNTPLRKAMSFTELEHEELKGFMDLGFTFKKEELSPRMMSVIPGLQRLEEYENEETKEVQGREDKCMRPYLSEAWLIRRPDSPLLNLRIPRVLRSDDMKKHLRRWARTVASVVQIEN